MTLKLVKRKPPTKEEQENCEHEFKKAFHIMQGTVSECCSKCLLSRNPRPMTDEEAKEVYGE